MTDIAKIKTRIENESCRSKWERAVRDYALEMIDQCDKKNITSYKQLLNHCDAARMRDYAIAKELLRDLPRESWIDVQTRAVYQAILLLEHACFLEGLF